LNTNQLAQGSSMANEQMTTGDLLQWAESRVRKSDPDTSKQAADGIALIFNQLESEFMAALRELAEATSNEVAAKVAGSNFARRNSIRRRASDLVAKHAIEEAGIRPCEVTGKKATVYRVCGT